MDRSRRARPRRHVVRSLAGLALAALVAPVAGCGMNGGSGGSAAVAPAQLILVKSAGDAQSGMPGQPLASPLVVTVRDQAMHPVAGTPVTFSVGQGGGSLADTSSMTDALGQAHTSLVLGTSPGTNTVIASAGSVSTTFTATAIGATTSGGAMPSTMFLGGFSSRVIVGTPGQLVVTVRDTTGATCTGYAGTVHVSSTDPLATLPADYTFTAADLGTHSFQVTLNSFGSWSISAADTQAPALSGTEGPIVAGAGPATHLVVTGMPTSFSQGARSDLTVTAADANGYADTLYSGAVHLATTDAGAGVVIPSSFTFGSSDAGVKKFPLGVILQSGGAQSIMASDASGMLASGKQTVTVTPTVRITSLSASKAKVGVKGTDPLSWTLNAPPATLTLSGTGTGLPKSEPNSISGSDTPAAPFSAPPAGVDPRAWYRLTATSASSTTEALETAAAGSGGSVLDDSANAVASFADGSYVVAGSFSGTATISSFTLTSSGGKDVFVARYNANGTLAWAKSAGGSGDDAALGIAARSDGSCVVTGYFSGTATFGPATSATVTSTGGNDIFVASYKTDGTLDWVQTAGGTSDDVANAVAAFNDGSFTIVGSFAGTATFAKGMTLSSLGGNDIFVAHYTATGTPIWAKSAGGTSDDAAYGIAACHDGRSVVTGSFTGTAAFGTLPAVTSGASGAATDAFVASFNGDGSVGWVAQGSSSAAVTNKGLAATAFSDGSSAVSGSFQGAATFGTTVLTSAGGADAFVARYDAKGNLVWAVSIGGAGDDAAAGLAAFPDGSLAVTGSFQQSVAFGTTNLTSSGGKDAFFARLGSTGSVISVTQIGGIADDQGTSVGSTSDGSAVVAGSFASTITVGPGCTLTSNGGQDAFAVKLAPVNYRMLELQPQGFSFAAASSHTSYGYMPGVISVSAFGDGSSVATGGFYANSPRFDSSAALSPAQPSSSYLPTRTYAYSYYTAYVVKYRSDGSVAWAAAPSCGTSTGHMRAGVVAALPDGGCIATGYLQSSMAITWAPTVTTSGGPGIYLVRYNSSGVATQAKVFPVSSLNTLGVTTYPGLGLCAFPDGTCAITGSTTVAAAFDTYTMTASSSGYVSAFIAHMKSDFTTDWLVEISSSKGHCYEMGAQSIAATPDGGMVTTGNYYTVTGSTGTTATVTDSSGKTTTITDSSMPSGISNGYVVKLKSDGTVSWTNTTAYGATSGSAYVDNYGGLGVAPDGSFAVHGSYAGAMTFGKGETNATTLASTSVLSPFTAKYNSDGTLAWAKAGTSTSTVYGYGVACFGDGTVAVTGYQGGSTTFGSVTVSTNCYLVRYKSDGTVASGTGWTASNNTDAAYPHMAGNRDTSVTMISKHNNGTPPTLGGGTGDGYSQTLPTGLYEEFMIFKYFGY